MVERRRKMARSFTLPTAAALALAGTGLGIYLGKSAIAEINPAYFGSVYSETRFHADLVPNRPDWDSVPSLFRDASLETGLGVGCFGCRSYLGEYRDDPVVDVSYASYEADADAIIEKVDREIARLARVIEEPDIERYAHFPVSYDEQAVRLAKAEPEEAEPAADCTIETQCEGDPTPGI
jgi:hypothetical protein